jgi:two-component system phosphate regulon response regulator OmpR
MVAEYLGRHGFRVRTASGGAELDACLAAAPADMLILDVNMPGEDGFSIARRVRTSSSVPILMLTAADDIVDRVVGLELGADDYLTKPFDLRELRARLRTILRRSGPQPAASPPEPSPASRVRFGDAVLDLESHRLTLDGADVPLTTMEFDLLQVFARNPNRVLTREQLLDSNRGGNEPFDRSIDVRVTRIRRKIETDPGKPAIIQTVRGAGYMFVPIKT